MMIIYTGINFSKDKDKNFKPPESERGKCPFSSVPQKTLCACVEVGCVYIVFYYTNVHHASNIQECNMYVMYVCT